MSRPAEAPRSLHGFDHIRKFWDPKSQAWIARIHPGRVLRNKK